MNRYDDLQRSSWAAHQYAVIFFMRYPSFVWFTNHDAVFIFRRTSSLGEVKGYLKGKASYKNHPGRRSGTVRNLPPSSGAVFNSCLGRTHGWACINGVTEKPPRIRSSLITAATIPTVQSMVSGDSGSSICIHDGAQQEAAWRP